MLTFDIGHTTVHLWPLIILFLITIVGAVIHAIMLSKRNKELVELCREGKYNDSIALAKKQLNYYQRTLKNKNTKAVIEMIYLHLAISYFGLSDDEQFVENITQIADGNSEKNFWLALFYLEKNDLIKFQTQYDVLCSTCTNKNYLSYLSSIKKLRECDDADAKDVLSGLESKLNFKLLKDISQKNINN